MRESGFYPPGAEHDPNAPYNEVERDAQEFEATVAYCIDCQARISTDEYIGGYIDEDGFYIQPEFNGTKSDIRELYERDYPTPMQLLQEYADYLRGCAPTPSNIAKISLIDGMTEVLCEAHALTDKLKNIKK